VAHAKGSQRGDSSSVRAEMFKDKYADVFSGSDMWKDIKVTGGDLYEWDEEFHLHSSSALLPNISRWMWLHKGYQSARVLGMFGDSITTDHISPAGNIAIDSPAGKFCRNDVAPQYFNSYGARRGNDQVMARGTFANIRLKNQLVAPKEGNWTKHHTTVKSCPSLMRR
jgi:aconitate hydratase